MKIAIGSGKGGTGKTLLSTNLFYAIHKQNQKITLVDCDSEEPNDMLFFKGEMVKTKTVTQKNPVIDSEKCVFCDKCNEWCNYNAIFYVKEKKVIRVLEDLCHGCGACSVACEFGAITEKDVELGVVNTFKVPVDSTIIETRLKVGVYTPVPVLKAGISEKIDTDHVIFDSPPGTSCPFIQTVERADYVILITEPTPFGLSDLRQSVETLKTMNKKYGVVVNRADLGDNALYDYLKSENIPLLMEIPFSKKIAEVYSRGELYAEHDEAFAQQLYSLYIKILKNHGISSN
ncbi:MAG: ATP-binding protein [Salinivirgaceae bacterium]|nr:ATP-binding protein [Salinivirgaceae bacterium]MDD4745821.1 ATP-binding protein [Salinivirgaceae bacterium]MDY0280223.1 ATP-binding protein [Salinivirgaceae bacterium]